MERSCANCDHVGTYRSLTLDGGRHESPGQLVCRRYPPQFVTEHRFNEPSTEVEWPHVTSEDRCGEFTPKQDVIAD